MSGLKVISNFFAQRSFLLEKSLENFVEKASSVPQIGAELEFYLLDSDSSNPVSPSDLSRFVSFLEKNPQKSALIYCVEKEKGSSQIELKFSYISDLSFLCAEILQTKKLISEIAVENGFVADFSAQIFADDCGNALQFNLSLHDFSGKNLFESDFELVKNSVAGMLDFADQMMVFCVADQKDFSRFNVETNRNLHKKGKFVAPTFVSCGIDNRSALVRYFKNDGARTSVALNLAVRNLRNRIEFRLPCANSDPYLILSSLLFAVLKGVLDKKSLIEKNIIYGNVFDEKYADLKKLAGSLDDAAVDFVGGELEEFLRSL